MGSESCLAGIRLKLLLVHFALHVLAVASLLGLGDPGRAPQSWGLDHHVEFVPTENLELHRFSDALNFFTFCCALLSDVSRIAWFGQLGVLERMFKGSF